MTHSETVTLHVTDRDGLVLQAITLRLTIAITPGKDAVMAHGAADECCPGWPDDFRLRAVEQIDTHGVPWTPAAPQHAAWADLWLEQHGPQLCRDVVLPEDRRRASAAVL